MKKLYTFTFLALALISGAGAEAYAQTVREEVPAFQTADNMDINEDGSINHGSYLTNPWYDNWTFGIALGAQTQFGSKISPKPAFAVDAYAIKWFTPVIAARLGYTGFNGHDGFKDGFKYCVQNLGPHSYWNEGYDAEKEILNYTRHQFRFDLMWNATNTFLGYRYNRFWTISPYLSGGYMRLSQGRWSDPRHDNEMFAGVGLYNTFRITDHINATFDLRSEFYSARYHWKEGGVVSNLIGLIGISYTIHKWYWDRSAPIEKARDNAAAAAATATAAAAAATAAVKAAEDKLADVQAENKTLKDEVENPKTGLIATRQQNDELLRRIAEAELVVYYEIDVDKLNSTEALRLDQYVKDAFEKNPKHVFYLTGSADKGTGNEKINTRLSTDRAGNIKKLLMHKYGVPESQIVIKATIISDKHEDGRLDRCVLLENQ